MEDMLSKVYLYLITNGINIVVAILIFVIGRWVAKLTTEFIEKIMLKAKMDKTLASFLKDLSFFGIMAFVIIAALNKIGVETTSLVAVVGAAGLAIGLALQGSLANFAAGVVLIIFKPFKVGDYVQGAGTEGVVEEIQIFNTILKSLDNKKIVAPNAQMTGDNIINYTAYAKRRIDLVFGISYSDDIKVAKDALMKVLKEDERVLKTPEPFVGVSELGDSSVNLVCRPWVKPANYWACYFDITEKGKIALEANGITIPFPQRDVHLFQEK